MGGDRRTGVGKGSGRVGEREVRKKERWGGERRKWEHKE